MSAILVTGGAGYIGSHIVRRLTEIGESVVVLDDLSAGHREAIGQAPFVEGDFGAPQLLDELFGERGIEFVIHMAAYCEVGASVADPATYYANNVTNSLALLDAAVRHGVRGIVFSSSAAVYGEPLEVPITEEHPQNPTNPYGETKLVIERALDWYHRAYGMSYVALRYFNAAGAHLAGDIGEDHAAESHLIPRLLQAVGGEAEPTPIFGEDYPTKDGTCVRDYVHVVDLAQAHVKALSAMAGRVIVADSLNLGNGEGFTVREVIDTVGRVTGQRPPTRPAPRRDGDPATLVASSSRAAERLGWKPEHSSLEGIVNSAWQWHRTHPGGYSGRG